MMRVWPHAKNSLVPGESCFNLNFCNPGSTTFVPPILIQSQESGDPTNVPNPNQPEVPQESATPTTESHIRRRKRFEDPNRLLPNGKKTKGRVKINMEYIDNKLRRYTTFSKRKTGLMKKAYELSTLTGTEVMLLVASETGHVYIFATKKLQPMITSEAGKTLIQTCLNTPDSHSAECCSSSMAESVEAVASSSGSTSLRMMPESGPNTSPQVKVPRSSASSGAKFQPSSIDLPTMVTSVSATLAQENHSNTLDADSDDSSSDESFDAPEVSRPSDSDHVQEQTVPLQNGLPDNDVGVMSGLNPSGTLMYQMPQGVVYAPTVSLSEVQHPSSWVLNIGNNQLLNNQQQIITIPISSLQTFDND